MNRYFLHFEVNNTKFWQTTFIAENTDRILIDALDACALIIEKNMPNISFDNVSVEIKQISFLGEIGKSETESKKAPFEQIAPQKQKQNDSFLCECGAKFQTVQARSGHKKKCKL